MPPPAQDTEAAYFYDSLSPYGSWMYVSGYGWCWQPTVVVGSVDWRPYCDGGSWYWSDSGWYWRSSYSWGWAPFHYGRWFHHGHAGWIWCPGTVWGPAWVSWRYNDGFCGWAPLPPAAVWTVGIGFTHLGVRVGIGFDFGLSYHHYAYVPTAHFCDYQVRRYCEPVGRVQSIHQHTTVINNYAVSKTTFVNNGMGHATIAKHVGPALRTVTIRDRAVDHPASIRSEHVVKEGSRLVVDRPVLPKTPPPVRTAVVNSPVVRSSPGARSSVAGPASSLVKPAPAAQPARANGEMRPMSPNVNGSRMSTPAQVAPSGNMTKPNVASGHAPSTGSFVPTKPAGPVSREPSTLRKDQPVPRPDLRAAPAPSSLPRPASQALLKEPPRLSTTPATPSALGSSTTPAPSRLAPAPAYAAPSVPPRALPQPVVSEAPRMVTTPAAPPSARPAAAPAPSRSAPAYTPAPAPSYTPPTRSAPSYTPAANHSAPSYSVPASPHADTRPSHTDKDKK